jgi:hypothetical protein
MYRDDYDQVSTLPDGFKLDLVTSTDGVLTDSYVGYFYWRIMFSGALIVRSLAWEDAYWTPKGLRRIFVNSIVAHIAEATDALVRLYAALSIVDEEITWRFTLTGTNERQVEDGSQSLPAYGRLPQTRESSVSYTKTLSIEEWSAGMLGHIVAAAHDILEQLNALVISDEEIGRRATEHLNRPRR